MANTTKNNKMYIALMDSESFSWIALGTTKTNAKKALLAEWNEKAYEPFSSVKAMDDEYGITVIELKPDTAARWQKRSANYVY